MIGTEEKLAALKAAFVFPVPSTSKQAAKQTMERDERGPASLRDAGTGRNHDQYI